MTSMQLPTSSHERVNSRCQKILLASASLLLINSTIASDQSYSLGSHEGSQLGLTLSTYRYEEPSLDVAIKATKIGIDYSKLMKFSERWFARADARYANGEAKYSGSGHSDGNDWYAEIRALIGLDIRWNTSVISPYSGVGYRYLFNDLRGLSSTGAVGYRRESHYFYLPIGVSHQMEVGHQTNLRTTLEYDHLLRGRQVSRGSDTVGYNGITYAEDAVNRQTSGFGIKASMMYEAQSWSVGPYFEYWNIANSKRDTTFATKAGTDYLVTVIEPKNRTTEFGVKVNYRF